MTDIKLKKQRYADKENLKKLMRYSKNTFATQSEINEKFYTKEQIDTMLESGSGGTGGGSTGGGSEVGDATIKINYGSTNLGSFTTNQSADAIVDIRPINELISENFYTKEQIDTKLEGISGGTGGTGGGGSISGDYYTKSEIDTKLDSKANTNDLSNYYTKSEVDNLLNNIRVYPITNGEIEEICVL